MTHKKREPMLTSKIQRQSWLDGVVIPNKPIDADNCADCEHQLGVWYQTINTKPFLYLPPASTHDQLAEGISIPHMSIDVLIAVRTPGNDLIVLTGWFNYAILEWQYYGVDPRAYADYIPAYWRFMPLLPPGFSDDHGTPAGKQS